MIVILRIIYVVGNFTNTLGKNEKKVKPYTDENS